MPIHPLRRRFVPPIGRAVLTIALAGAIAGCGVSAPTPAAPTATASPGVRGPICAELPSGTDPGNPAFLAGQTADVALTWLPVLAYFEGGTRATGLDAELRSSPGVTILAPVDDAFHERNTEDTLDDLILFRRDDLKRALQAHMIDGTWSLDELIAAGTVTTLAGTRLTVTAAGPMARFDDRAETICADYRAANARIHIIDDTLIDVVESPDASPDTH